MRAVDALGLFDAALLGLRTAIAEDDVENAAAVLSGQYSRAVDHLAEAMRSDLVGDLKKQKPFWERHF